jgi:hypothetical protein
MLDEKRKQHRERLVLPIQIRDDGVALTRDVSAAGVFFYVEGEHAIAGMVDFQMQALDTGLTFTALGEIVRVEYSPGWTGVAVRWVTTALTVDEQPGPQR